MSERRFSLLEREQRSSEEAEHPSPASSNPSELDRALERDGELQMDQSGAERTHFCQSCEAETRPGVEKCYNCGSAIGGADQAAFDELKRREVVDQREQARRDRRRKDAVEQARDLARRQREAELEAQTGGRSERSPAVVRPAISPQLAVNVVLVCLFATVSATLHLFLSAAYSDDVNWSVLAEVAIATVATWLIFSALHKRGR